MTKRATLPWTTARRWIPFRFVRGGWKARVVEALQEAAFFIMDAPAPSPEARNFRQHVFEGGSGRVIGRAIASPPTPPSCRSC